MPSSFPQSPLSLFVARFDYFPSLSDLYVFPPSFFLSCFLPFPFNAKFSSLQALNFRLFLSEKLSLSFFFRFDFFFLDRLD